MVEITYFPKKCPHCQSKLVLIKKMSAQWMECKNKRCPFLTEETEFNDALPFTYAHQNY